MFKAWIRREVARLLAWAKRARKQAIENAQRFEARVVDIAQRLHRRTIDAVRDDLERIKSANAAFGAECANMIQSPVFRTFHARTEAALIDKLVELPLEDDAGRLRLAIALQTHRAYADWLLKSAEVGRVAAAELQRLRTGRERKLRSL